MKKQSLTLLIFFVFITCFAQTGIGTHTPEGAIDISYPNNSWGMVLPQINKAEETQNPTGNPVKKGTIIYDLHDNCIKYFNGLKWSGCLVENPISLQCGSAMMNQDIIGGYPTVPGTTVTIGYNNAGTAVSYETTVVSSQGITGLTATLSPGTLQNGSGTLVFSVSGTPSGQGAAKFPLRIAETSCEFVITVMDYTQTKAPEMTNLVCDPSDQLAFTEFQKTNTIGGKPVKMDYTGVYVYVGSKSTRCNGNIADNGFTLNNPTRSSITITFSRPITNIGFSFSAVNGGNPTGESFAVSINGNEPAQLKLNTSCPENLQLTDNTITGLGYGTLSGGNFTVGGKWFTELTITVKGGIIFGMCLNTASAL